MLKPCYATSNSRSGIQNPEREYGRIDRMKAGFTEPCSFQMAELQENVTGKSIADTVTGLPAGWCAP